MSKKIVLALDEVLKARGMTRYGLSKRSGIQYQTIDKYYKNKVTRYDGDVLLKICLALNCEIGDILRIV